MIAQQLAVIRAENQQAIVQKAPRLQRVEDFAQLLIHRGNLGVVVPPHAGDIFFAGRVHVDRGLVLGLSVHFSLRRVLGRLVLQLALAHHARGHWTPCVLLQMPRQRVPWLVRAGKTYLQEKRLLALVIADPSKGGVADKDIRVKALLQVPRDTLIFL